jgi:hypothetical protein
MKTERHLAGRRLRQSQYAASRISTTIVFQSRISQRSWLRVAW